MKKANNIKAFIIIVFLNLFFIQNQLSAQGISFPSFAEAGFIQPNFNSQGYWKSQPLPGFGVQFSGLEFSYYAGNVSAKNDNNPSGRSANAAFLHFGFNMRFYPFRGMRLLNKLHVNAGFGVGSYGVDEGNGTELSIKTGVECYLTKKISLCLSFYLGKNLFSSNGADSTQPNYSNNLQPFALSSTGYLSTQGWFAIPSLTLRFNTSLMDNVTSKFDKHVAAGTVTYVDNAGNVVGSESWGAYDSYFQQSHNILNVYPKMLIGSFNNEKGATVAGGIGTALRFGIFAFDFEWLTGRVGYRLNGDDNPYHTYWDVNRKSFGLGINILSFGHSFEAPSFFRIIIGDHLGFQSLTSHADPGMVIDPTGAGFQYQNFRNKFFGTFYASMEIGSLAINFDYVRYTASSDKIYGSGYIIGITYLISLGSIN